MESMPLPLIPPKQVFCHGRELIHYNKLKWPDSHIQVWIYCKMTEPDASNQNSSKTISHGYFGEANRSL